MPPSTSEPSNFALTTWRTSGAITDAVHTEAELTPEDYLWETLPGRCCFSGRWDDVQDPPAWVAAGRGVTLHLLATARSLVQAGRTGGFW